MNFAKFELLYTGACKQTKQELSFLRKSCLAFLRINEELAITRNYCWLV